MPITVARYHGGTVLASVITSVVACDEGAADGLAEGPGGI